MGNPAATDPLPPQTDSRSMRSITVRATRLEGRVTIERKEPERDDVKEWPTSSHKDVRTGKERMMDGRREVS